jgi:hypothetical protein
MISLRTVHGLPSGNVLRAQFGAVQASLLGLLALLLGCLLKMVDQRHKGTRVSMSDDQTPLVARVFRTKFLSEPRKFEFKRFLSEYLGILDHRRGGEMFRRIGCLSRAIAAYSVCLLRQRNHLRHPRLGYASDRIVPGGTSADYSLEDRD